MSHDPKRVPFSLLGCLVWLASTMGSFLVLVIMLVILLDIFGRYFFNAPLLGAAELVVISITAIVFLQMPGALRAQRVIMSDGFIRFVSQRSVRLEQWLLALHHLVGAVMFTLVACYVWPLLSRVFHSGDYYGVPGLMTFPKWPVYGTVMAGSLLMAFQYVALTVAFTHAGVQRRGLFDADEVALQGHGDVHEPD